MLKAIAYIAQKAYMPRLLMNVKLALISVYVEPPQHFIRVNLWMTMMVAVEYKVSIYANTRFGL